MTIFNPALYQVVRNDPRFAYEAYEFLFHALNHTQKMLGREPSGDLEEALSRKGPPPREHHVSGPELLDGVRDLALREFGLMARTVFKLWGIRRTGDFGEMVFNLIAAGLMSKTDDDERQDFEEVYDLDKALVQGYRIQLDEALGS